MECLAVFIGLLIAFALLVGVGGTGAVRASRSATPYELLARRYHGRWYRASWFGHPRALFSYRNVMVTVAVVPSRPHANPPCTSTQVALPWADAAYRCEVYAPPPAPPTDFSDSLKPCVPHGNELCSNYAIRTNDEETTKNLLNEGVFWHFERIRQLNRHFAMCIDFSGGELRIRQAKPIYEYAELMRFVDASLGLYDQLVLSGSQGIDFVEVGEAQLLDDVKCSVCGEVINDDLVFCRRCKTPHHRDCWLYAGVCSVYGCGEETFDVPRVAQHAPGNVTTDGPETG